MATSKTKKEKKLMTLAFVRVGDKILLGRKKKKGFGYSKWNGLGGKVEPDEEIDVAMIRETFEECGINVEKYCKIGTLHFYYIDDPDMETHVYRIDEYGGKEDHSFEMEIKWHDSSLLPFAEMWPDDTFWMPYFLANNKFVGEFFFDEKYNIVKHKLSELKSE